MALPTLIEYFHKLERHDWYYEMSDDISVWRRGQLAQQEIEQIARDGGDAYKALLDEWTAYRFSGPTWGTPKLSRPRAPGVPSHAS